MPFSIRAGFALSTLNSLRQVIQNSPIPAVSRKDHRHVVDSFFAPSPLCSAMSQTENRCQNVGHAGNPYGLDLSHIVSIKEIPND